MNTLRNVVLAIGFIVSFLTIGISDQMLAAPRTEGGVCYPFVMIAAVFYLQWFAWYAFVPLKRLPEAERAVLEAQMKQHYAKGVFAGCMGLGYLLVGSYLVAWFVRTDAAPGQFYNPVWAGVALIALGLLSRLHGLLRFLLLERK